MSQGEKPEHIGARIQMRKTAPRPYLLTAKMICLHSSLKIMQLGGQSVVMEIPLIH